MIDPSEIKPNTPVVCSHEMPFGIVEGIEGTETIKLGADTEGYHHYIPMSWVTKVDDRVHLDRTRSRAMLGWSTRPPRTP